MSQEPFVLCALVVLSPANRGIGGNRPSVQRERSGEPTEWRISPRRGEANRISDRFFPKMQTIISASRNIEVEMPVQTFKAGDETSRMRAIAASMVSTAS